MYSGIDVLIKKIKLIQHILYVMSFSLSLGWFCKIFWRIHDVLVEWSELKTEKESLEGINIKITVQIFYYVLEEFFE